jgi:transcription termination factor Rho
MNRSRNRGHRGPRRPLNTAEGEIATENQSLDGAPASDGAPAPVLAAAPMDTPPPPVAPSESVNPTPSGEPARPPDERRNDGGERRERGQGGNQNPQNQGQPQGGDREFRHGRGRNRGRNRNRGGGGGGGGNNNQQHQQNQQNQRQHHQGPREDAGPSDAPTTTISGILDLRKDNTAFLRRVTLASGEVTGDAFIGGNLRPADYRPGVEVTAEAVSGGGRAQWAVRKIVAIDSCAPEDARNVPPFERGTVIDPHEWLKLETGKEPTGTRVMDLFCPIGKGTRGMIVAPPRSGKTILLKQIAQAIVQNHPDCKLIIVLVDERPEEVTDFKRSVPAAEVWASSNDETIQSHLDMCRLVISRSKRLVEKGQHVVMLLDSLTRLARAFNAAGEGAKGRTMSGGMAAGAMQEPRAIFGASRCLEEGGSLTIIATALVETGSAMDELIFQEFKGTGNMELVLERKLAEKRLWPAMDILGSGTRKDEKLQDAQTHKMVSIIRRYLSGMDLVTGMTRLLEVMSKTDSNQEVLKKFEP